MPAGLTFNVYGHDVNAASTLRGVAGEAEHSATRTSDSWKKVGAAIAGAFAIDKVKDFLGDSIAEATESQKVGAQTTAVLKSTGGAANVTAGQIGNLATAISNKAGIDDEAIQSGENMLLTFTNVRNEVGKGNDIFSQATQTLTDMSVATGTDMPKSAIQLGKALNDPIKGVGALARVGVTFTDGQKKQIAAMVKSGNTMGAQKVILRELNKEFGGSAAAQATPAEKAAVAWGNLKEEIGNQLLPVIGKLANFATNDLVPALAATVHWISQNAAWIKPLTIAVLALWGAWKLHTLATDAMAAVQAKMATLRAQFGGTAAAAETSAAATAEAQATQSEAVTASASEQQASMSRTELAMSGLATQAGTAAARFATAEADKAEASALAAEGIARSTAATNSVLADGAAASAASAREFATAMRAEATATQEAALAIERANAQIVLSGRETAVATETSSASIVTANEAAGASGVASGAGGAAAGGARAVASRGLSAGKAGLGALAGPYGLAAAGSAYLGYKGGQELNKATGATGNLAKATTALSIATGPASFALGKVVSELSKTVEGAGSLSVRWQKLLAVEQNGTRITGGFAAALRGGGAAADAQGKAAAALLVKQSGLARGARAAGLTQKDLTNAVTGSDAAFNRVYETWKRSGKASDQQLAALRALRADYAQGREAARRYADVHGKVFGAEMQTAKGADVLSGKVGHLHQTEQTAAQGLALVRDRTDAVTHSVQANGRSLDANTSFGQKNIAAIRTQASASLAHAQAVYKQTGSVQKANDVLRTDRQRLLDSAHAAGLSKDETNKLANAIYRVPSRHSTRLTADTAAAERSLGYLKAYLLSLHDRTVRVNIISNGGTEQGANNANTIDDLRNHNAQGTGSWGGGGTWVGEHGAEFIPNLPRGSKILSHTSAMSQAAAHGGGNQINVVINMPNAMISRDDADRAVAAAMERVVGRGGTVKIAAGVR